MERWALLVVDTAIPGLDPRCRDRYIGSSRDQPDGRTVIEFTRKHYEARTFDTMEEAIGWWQHVHPHDPVRPDGEPNRPLTAYTVQPVELDALGVRVPGGEGGYPRFTDEDGQHDPTKVVSEEQA